MNTINIEKNENIEKTVIMEDVCSMEYYKKKDGSLNQVLKNIDLTCKVSEVWAVIGNSVFEIKLLLEIIGNIKPYQKGKCILVETGMMRKKRIIVPHTFYIGNKGMLINNMKVLEYLMFITSTWDINVIDRQEELLNLLIEMDLSKIALSDIFRLRDEEKAIILLLVAFLSKSSLIVFNLPDLKYNMDDINSIKNIVNLIIEKKRTLIFSTKNYKLADEISTNILVLNKGKEIYTGKKNEFIKRYDHIIFKIKSDSLKETKKLLEENIKEFTYKIYNEYIEVYNYNKIKEPEKILFRGLVKYEIKVNLLEKNIRNIVNSYREVVNKL